MQTKTYYSKMRQHDILVPDTKKKLKVRSFHPWEKYTTTSEALDLAIIELSEGFELSKTALKILDKIYLDGVKDLAHKESLTHSMSIYCNCNSFGTSSYYSC